MPTSDLAGKILLMSAESFSVREAAGLLGISVKAMQQALQRGNFPHVERDVNEETGRTKIGSVRIPREDLEGYAQRRGLSVGENFVQRHYVEPVAGALGRDISEGVWQRIAEDLARENVRLTALVRELESELQRLIS